MKLRIAALGTYARLLVLALSLIGATGASTSPEAEINVPFAVGPGAQDVKAPQKVTVLGNRTEHTLPEGKNQVTTFRDANGDVSELPSAQVKVEAAPVDPNCDKTGLSVKELGRDGASAIPAQLTGSETAPTLPTQPIVQAPASGGVSSKAIEKIADITRGNEILEQSRLLREQLIKSALKDQTVIDQYIRELPPEKFEESLKQASAALKNTFATISEGDSDLNLSEARRYQNVYANAGDKIDLALATLDEERSQGINLATPGTDLNPLARTSTLAEIFPSLYKGKDATSNDALVDRVIKFNMLPKKVQEDLLNKKLSLVEKSSVKMPNGQQVTVPLLHNGFVTAQTKKMGMNCTSLISSILPSDVRKGDLNTLELKLVWIYGKKGFLPNPPQITKVREAYLKKMSDAFIPVDLYSGETPVPGDLLVYRNEARGTGQVFLVKSYNPTTMSVEVIEATQSAGAAKEREFPLSLDPSNTKDRQVRMGLVNLRVKPTSNQVCTYREGATPSPPKRKNGGII